MRQTLRILNLTLACSILTLPGFARAAVTVTQILPPAALVEGQTDIVIDFDNDGIEELRFVGSLTQPGGFAESHVEIYGIAATPPNLGSWATPFEFRELVAASSSSLGSWISPTLNSFTLRSYFANGISGYWPTGTYLGDPLPGGAIPILPESGYLGVRFTLADGLHYGWVEVGVLGLAPTGFVRSYGWETDAGIPIAAGAPEPSRSVFLLLGMTALFCRRRRALGSG